MPARTNDYQKLVKTINHHLAPANAKITESAMLYDPEAETDREIDILVESKILNCDLKIGIECNTERAPLDVRKIESFREKHRKVGINQTVVVAKSGFTDSAKKYAKKNNIRLLTFNAAKSENWSKRLEQLEGLSMYARRYFLKELRFTLNHDAVASEFRLNTNVIVRRNGEQVPVAEFAAALYNSSNLSATQAKALRDNEKTGDDPWVKVGFTLNEAYEFVDTQGCVVKPQEIEIILGYRSNYRALDTRQVTYDGQEMVVGGFLDRDGAAHIAFSEVEGNLTGTFEMTDSVFPTLRTQKPVSEENLKKPPDGGLET
jgi:hypothetical protein